MLTRKYPPRSKSTLQNAPVRTFRLSPTAADALEQIESAIKKALRLDDKPSLGLLLHSVLLRYAKDIKTDKASLRELLAEIEANACQSFAEVAKRKKLPAAVADAQTRREAWDRSQQPAQPQSLTLINERV